MNDSEAVNSVPIRIQVMGEWFDFEVRWPHAPEWHVAMNGDEFQHRLTIAVRLALGPVLAETLKAEESS